jgi:hypothetical protein
MVPAPTTGHFIVLGICVLLILLGFIWGKIDPSDPSGQKRRSNRQKPNPKPNVTRNVGTKSGNDVGANMLVDKEKGLVKILRIPEIENSSATPTKIEKCFNSSSINREELIRQVEKEILTIIKAVPHKTRSDVHHGRRILYPVVYKYFKIQGQLFSEEIKKIENAYCGITIEELIRSYILHLENELSHRQEMNVVLGISDDTFDLDLTENFYVQRLKNKLTDQHEVNNTFRKIHDYPNRLERKKEPCPPLEMNKSVFFEEQNFPNNKDLAKRIFYNWN